MPDDIRSDTFPLAPETLDAVSRTGSERLPSEASNGNPGAAFGAEDRAFDFSDAGLALIGLHRRPRNATGV